MRDAQSSESLIPQERPVGGDETKLWFDYIKTLNERQLQSAQRSGLTTYLLIAAFAGTLYRFVPRLPQLLAVPGSVRSSITFALLEIDALCFASAILITLHAYCAEQSESRILPDGRQRLTQITIAILDILVALIAVAHLLVGLKYTPASTWVRSALIGIGLYWTLNAAWAIVKETAKIRKSLANRIPIPRFSALPFDPTLLATAIVCGFSALLLGVSVASLITYSRSLIGGWVQPWKASVVGLGFILLLFYLLGRWTLTIGQNSYLVLERDILLQNLSPKEIRTRFVKKLIGVDVSQWLDDLLAELKASNEEFKKFCESGTRQLEDIERINAEYLAERSSRAIKLVDEMDVQLDKVGLRLSQFGFRIRLFFEGYLGSKEREILFEWRKEFTAVFDDGAETTAAARKLISEIRTLVVKLQEGSPR